MSRRPDPDRALRAIDEVAWGERALDLHGCTVREALDETIEHLEALAADPDPGDDGVHTARIITGRGRHSPGGRAALRDAVRELLSALEEEVDDVRVRPSPGAGGWDVALPPVPDARELADLRRILERAARALAD